MPMISPPRTIRSAPKYAARNDFSIPLGKRFVTEADRVDDAGPEVIHDHIRRIEQAQDDLASLRMLAVDLNAFFGTIRAEKKVAVFARILSHLGARAFDRLHLDNFRAIVAE